MNYNQFAFWLLFAAVYLLYWRSGHRRQNAILTAGYKIRRFTAPDVLERPDMVIAQIRGELAAPALAA